MTTGCIFCTSEFADKYISDFPSEGCCVPDSILEHHLFVKVNGPEDIWKACKPMLDSSRAIYGKDINAYMVNLHGLKTLGTTLYRTERYAWFEHSHLYAELLEQLNF